MDFVRKTRRVGNSAGVLLPKSLLGSEVKVSVIKRPFDIKKETLKALHSYLDDIQGIYIMNENPAEILAISTKTKSILSNEKMKISLVPLKIIKKDIQTKEKLRQKLSEAKIILNRSLIDILKKEIRG